MGSRSDPETRQASLLLSGLVLTPDSALETFRERRVADKELDVAHLKRARDLLDYVSAAINSGETERWMRIEEAWRLFQGKEAAPAVLGPPARVTSPWAGSAEPPRRPPPPPRPRAPTPPPMEPTEALDMDALKRDAEEDDLEGTMPVDRALKRPGLPFSGAVEPPPPTSSSDSASDILGKTAYLDPSEPRDVQTLPFDKKSPIKNEEITTLHTRPSAPESLLELEPEPSSKMEPTERLSLDTLPEHLSKVTLEQHAALSAECSVYPEWKEQIHARYGIKSRAERELLDRHFQKLMDGDRALADQWRWQYQRYENWTRAKSGR